MRRRTLITLIAVAAATRPFLGRAQPRPTARIGALHIGNADAEAFRRELRDGLRELGHIEGQNIAFEFRSADGKLDRLPELAAELVRLKVDIIVALYTPCALAAKQATSEIPIVVIAGDPLETGLVASLARPGGNITGLSLMAGPLHGKCVELFRDMLPAVRYVAALGNATDPVFGKLFVEQMRLAGRTTGIDIQPVIDIRDAEEADAAFATMVKARADAVVIQGSLSTKRVADLALQHRLPAASVPRSFANAGGLMSYGWDEPTSLRRSALFVHKILQGGNPAEMPIEQPIKFELALNLRTAKAIGVSIPELFLSRADTVIE
jgi:putative tryptophan/tyrosine transport system substrate-binding protein